MSKIMQDRTIISKTSLQRSISMAWNANIVTDKFIDESLNVLECKALFDFFGSVIDKEANKLLKSIDFCIRDSMYLHLDDMCWYQAALIVEIFRNPAISKNANSVDTKVLQHKIHSSLKRDCMEFLIGWGQAKRYCGGLKTGGYYADFSELYSILTMYIIMQCVHNVCGKK